MRKPSRDMVDAALRSIEVAEAQAGRPLIEETIGPVEVHTLGAPGGWPTQEQYRSVATRYCTQHAELQELRKQLAAERRMGAETERHLRIAERSLEWYERRNRSLTRALWAAASMLAVMALAVAWRAM